jgi:hypothetical protein
MYILKTSYRFQNPETQATLGTQDTVRRQTKQANSSEQKTEDIQMYLLLSYTYPI